MSRKINKVKDSSLSGYKTEVVVSDNGSTDTSVEIAKKFGKYRNRLLINISLDGSTAERHNKIRGWGFDQVITAIQYLGKQKIFVRAAMCVYPDTREDIEATLLVAKKAGATFFGFSRALPFGRAQYTNWDTFKGETDDQIRREYSIVERHKDFVFLREKEDPVEEEDEKCGAGYRAVVMNPDGVVRPCLLFPQEWMSFGNLFQTPPDQLFNSPLTEFFAKLKYPNKDREPCQSCEYKKYCNKCWARAVHKNITENLNCPWFVQSGIQQFLNIKQ